MRWFIAAVLTVSCFASTVRAQTRDTIIARVYVVLPQQHAYGFLLAGATLLISDSAGRKRKFRTGEDGVALVPLRLGKAAIEAAHEWRGNRYEWQLPIQVTYDLRSVTLDSANAISVTPVRRAISLSEVQVSTRRTGVTASEESRPEKSNLLSIMFPDQPYRFYSLDDLREMLDIASGSNASLSEFAKLASRPCTAEKCVAIPTQLPAAIAALLLSSAPIR